MKTLLAFQLIGFYGVYAICFWVGLIFALVSGALSGVFHGIHADSAHFGGPEGHLDVGHDAGHAGGAGGGGGHTIPDFPAFSPVTIATFVTIFGGTGMIFTRIPSTSPPYFSLPLAVGCAFGGSYGVFLLFSKIFETMQGSSEVVQSELIGQPATVITTIPANGMGEIAYVAGAGRQNAQARSIDGEKINAGTEVVIKKVVGGSFYVERKQ
ncbi:MAG: NfeD family protein [Verrucomicrobiia bacterium]